MTAQTITVTCRRQQPVIYTLTQEAEAPSGAGIAPHSEVCIGKPPGGVKQYFHQSVAPQLGDAGEQFSNIRGRMLQGIVSLKGVIKF